MSTNLELCQELAQEVGISGSGVPTTVVGQTGQLKKIVDFIKTADLRIQSMYIDWNFLWTQFSEALSATQTAVSAPTNPAVNQWDDESFYLDYNTDDYVRLKGIDWYTYRDRYRQGTKTDDIPSMVVIKPNLDLIIEPPCLTSYTLTGEYWAKPTAMTTNSATSSIPSHLHRIIIARAKMLFADHEEDDGMKLSAQSEFAEILADLKAAELPKMKGQRMARDTQNLVVRPS